MRLLACGKAAIRHHAILAAAIHLSKWQKMSQRARRRRGPTPEGPRGIWKCLEWLPQHEVAFVVVGGLAFALVTLLPYVLGVFVSVSAFFELVAVVWGFGMFLIVVLVTDDNPKYAKWGDLIRIVCGAVVGAGIALAFAAPLTGIALGFVIGAVLGFFGPHWAYCF